MEEAITSFLVLLLVWYSCQLLLLIPSKKAFLVKFVRPNNDFICFI